LAIARRRFDEGGRGVSPDGIRIVHQPIDDRPLTLVVVDAHRRTYMGLSRDLSYWHAIRPARIEDPIVGDGKRIAGELLCSCAGGSFGQRCYWTQLAEALEQGDQGFVIEHPAPADEDIAWMHDAAPGEVVEMMGR
jgi:hypothetical protein